MRLSPPITPPPARRGPPPWSRGGGPEGAPLWPVVRMRLSRTITAPTASRGHVERVATSCEILMKYSSHEGRTFFRVSCSRVVSTSGFLKGSIEPVARVAEARNDKRALVQLGADGGGVEVDVGVLGREASHAGHGGAGAAAER